MQSWTEKYRPTSLDEIRGNSNACRDFRKWADTWESHKEAVILHGPPGIGKTTAAHAAGNDFGWDVIEMNASEQRTKDVVDRVAGGAANQGTLTEGVSGRRLVVLDEADSLHGNVDRGGTGAMTGVVKEAEQPVVLIANEFYEMSKGLRNACQDIEFGYLDTSEIAKMLRDIANAEDVKISHDALQLLANEAKGDVRGAVNDFRAIVDANRGEKITTSDVHSGGRNQNEGIFEYLDYLFKEADPQGAVETSRRVQNTPDELFQWVEDNIVKEYDTRELVEAYTQLARADQWLGRVRSTQEYSYWRYANFHTTAGVPHARQKHHGGWTRFGPPSIWMKLGRTKGTRAQRDEIAGTIAERSSVSPRTARDELLPLLGILIKHCKPKDLTTDLAQLYEWDEGDVSFVTGSGKSTNKVESIVESANEQRRQQFTVEGDGSHNNSSETQHEQNVESVALGEFDTDNSIDGNEDASTTEDGSEMEAEDEDTKGTQTTLF